MALFGHKDIFSTFLSEVHVHEKLIQQWCLLCHLLRYYILKLIINRLDNQSCPLNWKTVVIVLYCLSACAGFHPYRPYTLFGRPSRPSQNSISISCFVIVQPLYGYTWYCYRFSHPRVIRSCPLIKNWQATQCENSWTNSSSRYAALNNQTNIVNITFFLVFRDTHFKAESLLVQAL